MKHVLYAVIFCVTAVSAYAINPPANLTATPMRDANGQQYFHLSFSPVKSNIGQFISYYIYRWLGAAPDTVPQGVISTVEGWDGDSTYNDHDPSFNPVLSNANFQTTYSYAVVASDSVEKSGLSNIVSGTLDPVYLYFDSIPRTYSATIGDTVKWNFRAHDNTGNSTIAYSAISGDTSVLYAMIGSNGDFSGVVHGYGASNVTVKGTDAVGRSALYSFTVAAQYVFDSIRVTLLNADSSAIPSGTVFYYSMIYADNAYNDSTMNSMTGHGYLGNPGIITVPVLRTLKTSLRVGAEGYNAQWAGNSSGDPLDLSQPGSYTVLLTKANTHTVSGTVTNENGKPFAGVGMNLYRWMSRDIMVQIGNTTTDASGNYQLTESVGDSILGTLSVQVSAYTPGYSDGVLYSDYLSSSEDHDSINFQFKQRITSTQVPIYLKWTMDTSRAPYNGQILTSSIITIYQLSDTATTIEQVDTTTNGYVQVSLPNGEFIVFAQPDTGYQSGYYSMSGYAPTWNDADTIILPYGTHLQNGGAINIILPADSSIAMNGGNGSEIDGVVRDQNGNIAGGAHLLLYRQISAPAGGNTSRLLYTTTADALGNYSFTKVPVGMYMVLVDIVGKPLFETGSITIAKDSQSVTQNITYNPDGVSAMPQDLPVQIELAQNYPNPFTDGSDIMFAVPENNAKVRVAVYNDMGRMMGVIAEGRYAQGQYTAHVDATAYPAGVYNYVLNVNGKIASRRMIVVR